MEFVPSSLHEEWATALSVVHNMLESSQTEAKTERALNWILWLPHSLLRESSRGGKNENNQYRDNSRRFSLWMRQRDTHERVNEGVENGNN
jgi:hypothetical protein